MQGGPGVGCAGWDGAGWFPRLQLREEKNHTGDQRKIDRPRPLSSYTHAHTPLFSRGAFSGLGIAVARLLWKIGDTGQLAPPVCGSTSGSKEDGIITTRLFRKTAF